MAGADAIVLAQAVAAELARVAEPGVEAWGVGVVAAPYPGYLDQVGVLAVCAGRPRTLAIAVTLPPLGTTVTTLVEAAPAPRFEHARHAGPDDVAALAARIRAWHRAAPDATNPLDAAHRLRHELAAALPAPDAAWFVTASADARAWAAVQLGTADHAHVAMVTLAARADGVGVQVADDGAVCVVRTPAELDAQLPAIVAAARARLAARAAFHARPFRAGGAARVIVDALRPVAPPHGRWSWRAVDDRWPTPAPWATVWWGTDEHRVASLVERAGAVHVTAGVDDVRPARPLEVAVADAAALDAALPAIVAAIRRQLGRLTDDRLVVGRRYRALAPYGEPPLFAAGATYVFRERLHVPYDGTTLYTFVPVDGGAPVRLDAVHDAHAAWFQDLDHYLAEVAEAADAAAAEGE